MARIVEKTVYQFSELSDDAKERARDWCRGCIESDELFIDRDDVETVAGILGISFGQHSVRLMGGGTRYKSTIYWSLDPNECAFAGSYTYAKGAPKAIRQYAPEDTELHRIADELQSIQRINFYRLTAECNTDGRNGFRMGVYTDDGLYGERNADELTELLRDFAAWIVKGISAERDYLYSDESVDEMIDANGYEFDESGNVQ